MCAAHTCVCEHPFQDSVVKSLKHHFIYSFCDGPKENFFFLAENGDILCRIQ